MFALQRQILKTRFLIIKKRRLWDFNPVICLMKIGHILMLDPNSLTRVSPGILLAAFMQQKISNKRAAHEDHRSAIHTPLHSFF